VSVPQKLMGALDAHRVFIPRSGRTVSEPNKQQSTLLHATCRGDGRGNTKRNMAPYPSMLS